MSPETRQLTNVIRAAIRILGLRYQDVEEKLGVAPGYLSRLFRGVMQLRVDHVGDIARVIGMEPEEIFQIAFPHPRNPPSAGALRLREMTGTSQLLPPEPAMPAMTAKALPTEETERIERIVLQVFEKFFSSIAKNAAERQ